jgi:predicted Zn-dependent peptidase
VVAPWESAVQAQLPRALPFEQYKLPNGLDVILSPDHNAQVVAVSVWYDVGVRDERPGEAGYAHLAENLMFDGSANVPPSAHLLEVNQIGGDASSDTEDDITRYYEVLPSNQLAWDSGSKPIECAH